MQPENRERLYDVVIVGGGPAGLTAALYLARARYRVVVLEKEHFGGQITITSEVVNYPGVSRSSGSELTETIRRQAQSFGAEFLLAEAQKLEADGDIKRIHTNRGILECYGILIASGAHPRKIGFKGEEEFKGHGVAYCATCDGEFFSGLDVFVAGGGFAAAEESVFLTKYARRVTILIREEDFTCAKAVADSARNHDKITVLYNTVIEEVNGAEALNYLRYRNIKTGEVTEYSPETGKTFGVFVFAGYEPATELVKDIAELDKSGYIITDRNQKTNIDGLYAAGDVCVKNLRQVVTAVGDGALAATELERYAAAMQAKTGIIPQIPKTEAANAPEAVNSSGLFSEDMLNQLNAVFSKMENPLILRLYLDNQPVSDELRNYMEALADLTDKLSLEIHTGGEDTPCVKICRADGKETGLAFHGVPGGHEFTSFILGLYNSSGSGQAVDAEIAEQIKNISAPVDMRIMVSLSCTMCPELVTAAQRIASLNNNITAEVYDLNHFPDLKDKYKVMSVPCMVVNDGKPLFGKKNISQLLEIIK